MNTETQTPAPEAVEEAAKPETAEAAETEQEPRRKKRWAICRECGDSWNISRKAVIPPAGYLCPRCWSKYRSK